jgi:hypothetical protein
MGVAASFAVSIERTDETTGGRARALRAIAVLRQGHTVYAAESRLWALVVAQTRSSAIDVLRADLDAIDSGWSEVLSLS